MFDHDQPTDLQQDILQLHDRNPKMNPEHVAADVDCSSTYGREPITEYRTPGGLL
jgi:hypothetical protein